MEYIGNEKARIKFDVYCLRLSAGMTMKPLKMHVRIILEYLAPKLRCLLTSFCRSLVLLDSSIGSIHSLAILSL